MLKKKKIFLFFFLMDALPLTLLFRHFLIITKYHFFEEI